MFICFSGACSSLIRFFNSAERDGQKKTRLFHLKVFPGRDRVDVRIQVLVSMLLTA